MGCVRIQYRQPYGGEKYKQCKRDPNRPSNLFYDRHRTVSCLSSAASGRLPGHKIDQNDCPRVTNTCVELKPGTGVKLRPISIRTGPTGVWYRSPIPTELLKSRKSRGRFMES